MLVHLRTVREEHLHGALVDRDLALVAVFVLFARVPTPPAASTVRHPRSGNNRDGRMPTSSPRRIPVTAPSASTGATSGTTSSAVDSSRMSCPTSGGRRSRETCLLVGGSKSTIGLAAMMLRRFAHRKKGTCIAFAWFIRDQLSPDVRITPNSRSMVAESMSRTLRSSDRRREPLLVDASVVIDPGLLAATLLKEVLVEESLERLVDGHVPVVLAVRLFGCRFASTSTRNCASARADAAGPLTSTVRCSRRGLPSSKCPVEIVSFHTPGRISRFDPDPRGARTARPGLPARLVATTERWSMRTHPGSAGQPRPMVPCLSGPFASSQGTLAAVSVTPSTLSFPDPSTFFDPSQR